MPSLGDGNAAVGLVKKRTILALSAAVLGTVVFLGLRAVLSGLLEPPLYIVGCSVGAFSSCLCLAAPRQRSFAAWLMPATGICLTTYVFIGVAHLLHRVPTWDSTVPTEAVNLVLWATVATIWWLVPATAAVLKGMTAALSRMGMNG